MVNKELLLDDMAAFSDLGVTPPKMLVEDDGCIAIRLTRNGDILVIRFHLDGSVEEIVEGGAAFKHVSYKSLLASDRFGRLRDWAAVQLSVLESEVSNSPPSIPVNG